MKESFKKKPKLIKFTGIFIILLIMGFLRMPNVINHRTNQDKSQIVVTWKILASSDPDAFLSVWNTTKLGVSDSNQVKLPLQEGGYYNFQVDWGDGSPHDIITAWNSVATTHSYTASGVYLINITGDIEGWQFNNGGDKLKIIQILQWGCLQLGNSGSYFYGCSNLELTATDNLDLTGTTSLLQAFRNCINLGDTGSMESWDVSKVTNMQMMFYNSSSFNQPIGNWNVSSVTNMAFMFWWATTFNQPIGSWNVSNVQIMTQMFNTASAFNQPIGNWIVSKVVEMNFMFFNATSFNQSIAEWDVSSVTQMQYMFAYAYSFNQPLADWDVSKVTTMYYMFCYATSFNQYINDWDITSVTDLTRIFYEAHAFNQPLDEWDVSGITDMNYLFYQARSFNQPLDSWDMSSVTNVHHMFCQADAFNQPLDTWDVSKVTRMDYLFYGADSFNQSLNSWSVSSVTDMKYMFYYAVSFNQPLDGWDVSHVMDMSHMFDFAIKFDQSLNLWDVSAVTDMNHMFNYALEFNQSLDDWVVSNVTNMDYMFFHADEFNQPLGVWNVSNVSTMHMMLYSHAFMKENYDDLLVGWSQLTLQTGVDFYAGNTKYSSVSADERQYIITIYGWTIIDGGYDPLPDPFTLSSDAGNPDDDGIFNLFWSVTYGASNYSVYQHHGYITEINTTLSSLALETTELTLSLTGYTPDSYYFIVVANNEFGTILSNCMQITVEFSGTFTIMYPNSTASLLEGKAIFIRWTSTGDIANVKLELYDGNRFVMEIIASTPNTGMYGWLVPTELEESQEYRIKISDVVNPEIFSYSEYFEIYSNRIPGFNVFLLIGVMAIVTSLLISKNKSTMKIP
jgi:surface protein